MFTQSEIQITLWIVGSLVSLNFWAMTLFVFRAKLPESILKQEIRNIIFELDKFIDEMENNQKRSIAKQKINIMLGWWKFVIPSALIGWVIDKEVAAIRKMQQETRADMRLITLEELKQLALQSKSKLWSAAQSMNRDVKLYLHWSAARYGQLFDDYHINIDYDGSVYVNNDDLSTITAHTYKRNTGAIGISLSCCYNATVDNLGEDPPTSMQIESVSQVVAELCKALDLTVDINRVMTHAEAANNLDGLNPNYEANGYPEGKYGPGFSFERWDLWLIPGVEQGEGGNVLRGKAIWYQYNGVGT